MGASGWPIPYYVCVVASTDVAQRKTAILSKVEKDGLVIVMETVVLVVNAWILIQPSSEVRFAQKDLVLSMRMPMHRVTFGI